MTISEALYFVYDGINSQNMGVLNVNVGGGMFDENFLPERQVNITKVKGRKEHFFNGVDYSPLKFDLIVAFEDGFDDDSIRAVSRWLCQDSYKELYFSSNPDRRFYAIYSGNPRVIHTGTQQGYLKITFECDSPYSFSPVFTSQVYDFTSNISSGADLKFTNYGDVNVKPTMYIEIKTGSSFTIINNSDGGNKFSMTGLSAGEQITVDFEEEEISTSLSNVYRYDNLTSDSIFLPFGRGVNNLKVFGNIKLQIKAQFKILQ